MYLLTEITCCFDEIITSCLQRDNPKRHAYRVSCAANSL